MVITVELPSAGRIGSLPRKVRLNEWRYVDLKELSSASQDYVDEAVLTVLNRLIDRESTPSQKELDIVNFPMSDVITMLLQLRGTTLGHIYRLRYNHDCSREDPQRFDGAHTNEVEVDLSERMSEIKSIPSDYRDFIEVKLPSGNTLTVLAPTVERDEGLRASFEEEYGCLPHDHSDPDIFSLYHMYRYFVACGSSRFKKFSDFLEVVNAMEMRDVVAMGKIYDYFSDWGPSLTVEGQCENCSGRFQFRLPILPSYFRGRPAFEFDVRESIVDSQSS